MSYLIIEYNNGTKIMHLCTEEEMFTFVDQNKDKKIAVFKLGDCVIDWS